MSWNTQSKSKSQNITKEIMKDSSTSTVYETSKYYDICREKTHNILENLNINVESTRKQGGSPKLAKIQWYKRNAYWWF